MNDNITEINKDTFWKLIQSAKETCGQDMDAMMDFLKDRLVSMGPEQAQNFHDILHAYQDLADKFGLWDAAGVMKEYGCSDDGFIDFRAWLIAQCRLRAEVTWQRRRKEHEMAEIEKRHHLHIVLTPRQYRLLCSQAKQCRLTKRAYLASLIEGQPVKSRPSQEIKDLRTEIHHIGNNINQIARSVNAGIAKPEDARRGLYLLDQVYELMFQVANK